MRSAMEVTTNFPDPWPGGVWRPRDIMQMELIACHSVLSLAANYPRGLPAQLLRTWKSRLCQRFPTGDPIAYLIPAGQGRDENVAKMIGALVEQGVEVYRLDHELHAMHGEQVIKRLGPDHARPNNCQRFWALPGWFQMPKMHEVPPAATSFISTNLIARMCSLCLSHRSIRIARLRPVKPNDLTTWQVGPCRCRWDWTVPAVLSIREPANERKLTLIRSENEVRTRSRTGACGRLTSRRSRIPVKPGIRVGIYQGSRAATWTKVGPVTSLTLSMCPFESLRDSTDRRRHLRRVSMRSFCPLNASVRG